MASAPSPRPGPTLGSGQTQKMGRICADNSAAASICSAQGNRPAGPRCRVPALTGARSELGAPVDAAGALWCAFRAALPSPPPNRSSEHRAPQIKRLRRRRRIERKRETYLRAERSAGLPLRTRQVSGTADPG